MKGFQVVSDEALSKIETALRRGNHWLVISTLPYLIEAEHIHCFSSEVLAHDYKTYVEEEDESGILNVRSLADVLRHASGELSIHQFLNNTIMNEKNLSYLQDNLKYLGFGDKINEALQSQIKEAQPAFTISFHSEFNRQQMEARLHFKKSEQSDMYFFNKYDATLRHPTDQSLDRQASFYINKGNGVTVKEAFNLLNGRAINKDFTSKEGQTYNAWMQLDLKHKDPNGQYSVKMYHERYGFDMEKVLSSLPIKELKDPEQKEAMLKSLQKGNVQSVTFLNETGQEKRFIEAAPQYKTIHQYDEHLKPIIKESNQRQGISQPKTAQKNKVSESGEEEDSRSLKKKRMNKKGLSI
jgi:cell division inhibitor SulA